MNLFSYMVIIIKKKYCHNLYLVNLGNHKKNLRYNIKIILILLLRSDLIRDFEFRILNMKYILKFEKKYFTL